MSSSVSPGFIDHPTQPDQLDLEDALAQIVLAGDGDAGRQQELANLYHQCTEFVDNQPERELMLLRVAELLLEAGNPMDALEVLRKLQRTETLVQRRRWMELVRRVASRLEGRPQDLVALLGMELPLLTGEQRYQRALELVSAAREAGELDAVVDGCNFALSVKAIPRRQLEQVATWLYQQQATEQLERLIDGAARQVLKLVPGGIALLGVLAELAERLLADSARASKLWWEAWKYPVDHGVGAGPTPTTNLLRIHTELADWRGCCRVLQRRAMLAVDIALKVEALHRLSAIQLNELEDELAAATTLGKIRQLQTPGQDTRPAAERASRDAALRQQVVRVQLQQQWSEQQVLRVVGCLRRLDPDRGKNRELVSRLVQQALEQQSPSEMIGKLLRRAGLLLLPFLARSTRRLPTVLLLARQLHRQEWAAAYYRRVLELSPGDEEATAGLAALTGQNWTVRPTAEELARRAGELEHRRPAEAVRLLVQAAQMTMFVKDGDATAASSYLRRATDLSLPLVADSRFLVPEEVLRAAGLHAELARLLEARADAEDDPLQRKYLLCELGRIHGEAGHHPDRAVEALQQALMLDPEDDQLARRLRELYRALKDNRSRARLLESVLARTSGSARIPLTEELGALYAGELREEQAAAMHYEELLSQVPDHAQALPFCRAAYERAGDYLSVVRILGEAAQVTAERGQQAELHTKAARVAMQRLTDLELAIHHWQEAIRARPEDRSLRDGLRQVLETGGRWEELRTTLLAAVASTLDPAEKVLIYGELARVARKQDDQQAAAVHLLSALQLRPGDRQLLTELEEVHERLGQWRKLSLTLRQHARHEADLDQRLQLLLRAARVLLIRLGRDDEALSICGEILELRPGDREAATLKGEILGKRGQWEEKIALLREQIESEADAQELGRLHLELGRVLLDRMDDVDSASKHFEAALGLCDSGAEVLALLRRIYDARGRLDLLVQLLRRRARMPSLPPAEQALAVCEMARIQAEHLGEQEQAAAAFERALAMDPRCLPALTALREQAVGQKQWWDALELGRRELKLVEDPARRSELLAELGHLLYEQLDECQQAREALAEALEYDPNNTRAMALLGVLHFECQDWEETERVTARLVEVVRDQEDLHEHLYRLAFAQEKLGREEDAFRIYIRSFTRAPMYLPTLDRMVDLCFTRSQWDNTKRIAETILHSYSSSKSVEKQAELHLRIAMCDLLQGQREAATEYLQQLVLGSGDVAVAGPEAWSEVAEPWASTPLEPLLLHCVRSEVRDRVAAAAEKCVALVPDHSEALRVLAAVKISQQEWHVGLRALERAARSERTDPRLGAEMLVCAGEVSVRHLGEKDQAKTYFQWAQNLDPKLPGVKERFRQLESEKTQLQPILLTRPKRRATPPPPPDPPIRKRDTQPFRSGTLSLADEGPTVSKRKNGGPKRTR